MYSFIKPLLFTLDAERAHHLTLDLAQKAHQWGLLKKPQLPQTPNTVMGLSFPNPVGLAAGLDKNGAYIDTLAQLGFGFIEIGTVTPRPQMGNAQPRLFRLPKAQAIINRMGFNNHGVDELVANVQKSQFVTDGGIIGINIGKNADTPIENAVSDYLICMSKVYQHASYITVNISSPNTKNLRDLQNQDALDDLLMQIKQAQLQLANTHQRYVPVALKIAPDIDEEQIKTIADLLIQHKLDGVIATNTTLDKSLVEHLPHGNETGGLSGVPVRNRSNWVIEHLSKHLNGTVPIIGVGGILNPTDAKNKIDAGAQLVQLYSGLIYKGPQLVADCIKTLS